MDWLVKGVIGQRRRARQLGEADPARATEPRGAGDPGASPCPPCACAASRSASPASSRTTASTSRPPRARCTRCSARTAPARGRSRTSSPGLYRPDEGEIELYGEPVAVPLAARRARRRASAWCTSTSGSSRRSPSPRTSCSATTAARAARSSSSHARSSGAWRSSASATGSPSTRARAIWQLSVGEQQRVEILKALYREARILILDEPTAVLTPQEAEALFETLRAMAAEGRTVIFISHKLHEVKAVADRVTVLRGGRTSRRSPAAESTPRSLAALMVGRELDEARRVARGDAGRRGRRARARRRQRSSATAASRAVRDVSLDVRAGEIVGVAGVAGNGQRELAEAITACGRAPRARSRVDGRALRTGDPRAAIAAGVAHVPEDRLGTGVAPSLSDRRERRAQDATAAAGRRAGRCCASGACASGAVELIGATTCSAGPEHAGAAALGRQPAEGRARPRVRRRAARARRRRSRRAGSTSARSRRCTRTCARRPPDGVAMLLISEDLDEILALADRIVVMYEGASSASSTPETATVEEIGLLMAGGGDA